MVQSVVYVYNNHILRFESVCLVYEKITALRLIIVYNAKIELSDTATGCQQPRQHFGRVLYDVGVKELPSRQRVMLLLQISVGLLTASAICLVCDEQLSRLVASVLREQSQWPVLAKCLDKRLRPLLLIDPQMLLSTVLQLCLMRSSLQTTAVSVLFDTVSHRRSTDKWWHIRDNSLLASTFLSNNCLVRIGLFGFSFHWYVILSLQICLCGTQILGVQSDVLCCNSSNSRSTCTTCLLSRLTTQAWLSTCSSSWVSSPCRVLRPSLPSKLVHWRHQQSPTWLHPR